MTARPLQPAWLARDPDALRLVGADVRNRAAREAAVREASARAVSPELLGELRRQDDALPRSAARAKNLALLAEPGTTCVVTGQQVGLFLGPLYTFYKAATAVAAAKAFAAEFGVPCVPIFWLQTEDHDFAEIASCEAPVRDEPAPLRLELTDPAPEGADKIPVRYRALGDSVRLCLDTLEGSLDGTRDGRAVLELLRRYYVPGREVAQAFAGVLSELFAEDGLILFNPRERTVSQLWSPLLERAIAEEEEISRKLLVRCDDLSAAGFEPQVHVRADSPLVFVHPEGERGPRYRVRRRNDGQYAVLGGPGAFSRDELLHLARQSPWQLSSSALLRPLLQDRLLPTVAYVGGPGELGYVAQLAPLYAHFGMRPPLFLPRASFRVVDSSTRRALAAIGLTPEEAGLPVETLVERVGQEGARHPTPEALEQQMLEGALAAIAQGERVATALDPELQRAAERTRETIRRGVHRFAERYGRIRRERDSVARARVERARAALYPGGEPQERRLSWPAFGARVGIREFHALVREAISPFTPGMKDLLP